MSTLLTEEQLHEWTGFTRRADIERLLGERGVPWWPGRAGRICTTLAAIERGLGIQRGDKPPRPRVPDFKD